MKSGGKKMTSQSRVDGPLFPLQPLSSLAVNFFPPPSSFSSTSSCVCVFEMIWGEERNEQSQLS